MASRWGADGPPDDAYSRVTRDLDEVFAGLPAVVESRVATWVSTYDVVRRPLGPGEVPALFGTQPLLLVGPGALVLEPSDPSCSPLALVVTAHTVWLSWAGWGADDPRERWWPVPDCSCDACDSDLEGAVAELDQEFESVVSGYSITLDTDRDGRLRSSRRHATGGRTSWYEPETHPSLWALAPASRTFAPWPRRP